MTNKSGLVLLLLTTTTFFSLVLIPRTVTAPVSATGQIEAIAGTSTPLKKAPVSRETPVNQSLDPALLPICTCESGRGIGHPVQFNADGTVRRGVVNPHDIGMCQINSDYHEAAATKLGMDIYTTAGNIAYANYLYRHEGTAPWNWSKSCWGGLSTTSSQ